MSTAACVRIACKAFKMGVPFDFGSGGDPTSSSIAKSQKHKVDSMIVWDSNPFAHCSVKKVNNHYTMKNH